MLITSRYTLHTQQAINSQHRLPEIQGTRGISYAGAYWKYGFHEDGFTSGLRAALNLNLGGVSCRSPFDVVDAECEIQSVCGGGAFVEVVFEVLERWGVRRLCGWVVGMVLGFVGFVVELVVMMLGIGVLFNWRR